jgi:dCMP deaminase
MIENHCERTLHGEENAIINTQRADLEGATAYIIATPCIRCAKMLVNAGIREVNYLGEYANSRGREYLAQLSRETGVKFVRCKINPEKLVAEAVKRLEGEGGALAQGV